MSSEDPDPLNTIIYPLILTLLVLLSGLFSGLDLALMGLDVVGLKVLESGSEPDKTYAKQIKPLRKYGNWLSCTLTLGNVSVNAGLAILFGLVLNHEIYGFIVTTIIIFFFGEIIPQAIMSKHSLYIAAKTRYIVWPLMFIFGVFSYPVSIVLDKVLGYELEKTYSNKELQKLVDIHAKNQQSNVNEATANMLKGALGLDETYVKDVMTKWENVFYLRENTKLTFDILTEIFKKGHSRIPILSKKDNLGRIHIRGILYVKDLILIDPDDELPVTQIMNAFDYKIPPGIDKDSTLQIALTTFIQTTSHIAIVKEIVINDNNDNGYRYVGIITLEDVIEHILQTELIDEHDNFGIICVYIILHKHVIYYMIYYNILYVIIVDHQHTQRTARLNKINWQFLQQMFDHRTKFHTSLPPQELQAVYLFLSQSVKVFTPQHRRCSESAIKNLLAQSQLRRITLDTDDDHRQNNSKNRHISELQIAPKDPYADIDDNGLLLYQRDKKTEYFTLLLDGKCEIFAGRQGFRSELTRWSYLCPDSLLYVEDSHVRGKPLLDYVPDFTCKIVENSRVLRIRLTDWKACLEGKFDFDVNTPRPLSSPPPYDPKHSFPPRQNSEPIFLGKNTESKNDDQTQLLSMYIYIHIQMYIDIIILNVHAYIKHDPKQLK